MKKMLLFIFALLFVAVTAFAGSSANNKGGKVTKSTKGIKVAKATKGPQGNNKGDMGTTPDPSTLPNCLVVDDPDYFYDYNGGNGILVPYNEEPHVFYECSKVGETVTMPANSGYGDILNSWNDGSGKCGMVTNQYSCKRVTGAPYVSFSTETYSNHSPQSYGFFGGFPGNVTRTLFCIPKDCEAIWEQNGGNLNPGVFGFYISNANTPGKWHLAGQNNMGIDPCACIKGKLSGNIGSSTTAHTNK